MGFASSLLYALLMYGLPVAEAIYHDRSPGVILLLFWFETVLMVVTAAIRIVLHRRATAKAGHYVASQVASDSKATESSVRKALGAENDFLKAFLGLTVVFTIAHGVFVLLLVFLFKVGGPVSWQDARIALAYTVAVQAIFLLWDLPRIRGWSFEELGRNVGTVPIRVLVTQLGLIFGFPVIGMTGSGWGLVGTFVALRALLDASLIALQGLVTRRDLPPGLARVLSRTSKQPVETLEAEFDALKVDSKAIQALLETPISEVRREPRRMETGARS